jgi:hypothetical protein
MTLTDQNGFPCKSLEHGAKRLLDYWAPKFQHQPVNHESMEFLRPFIQQVTEDVKWELDPDQFSGIISLKKDSGVVRDGVAYSGLRAGGDVADDIL